MSKRKAYRPKAVLTNPLAAMRPMSVANAGKVMLHYYTALDSIRAGRFPGPKEWADLADMVNVCETAVKMGKLIDLEVIPDVIVATASMRKAAAGYAANGGMRLDTPGLLALASLAHVHEQLLLGLTEYEMNRIVAETKRVILDIQRRNTHEVVSL